MFRLLLTHLLVVMVGCKPLVRPNKDDSNKEPPEEPYGLVEFFTWCMVDEDVMAVRLNPRIFTRVVEIHYAGVEYGYISLEDGPIYLEEDRYGGDDRLVVQDINKYGKVEREKTTLIVPPYYSLETLDYKIRF